MTKIVIDDLYGFRLSAKARVVVGVTEASALAIKRDDARLIACVEELGREANGHLSRLSIVEIPDDVEWEIREDDGGREMIVEKHREWN